MSIRTFFGGVLENIVANGLIYGIGLMASSGLAWWAKVAEEWSWPATIALGLVVFAAILVVLERLSGRFRKSVQSTPIVGQHFNNTRIILDGRVYDHCIFENVEFVWNGAVFHIVNSEIKGTRRFGTTNPTVLTTVDILKFLSLLESGFAVDWKHVPIEYFKTS